MGLRTIVILALISVASAAPWRCYRTSDGSSICFGEVGQPSINPPSISINRPAPPCSGPATVYTPCAPPCAPPYAPPCAPPCDPSDPCDPLQY